MCVCVCVGVNVYMSIRQCGCEYTQCVWICEFVCMGVCVPITPSLHPLLHHHPLTPSLPHSLLPHSLLPHSLTPSLPHSITPSLHLLTPSSLTPSLHHPLTSPLPHLLLQPAILCLEVSLRDGLLIHITKVFQSLQELGGWENVGVVGCVQWEWWDVCAVEVVGGVQWW